MPTAIIASELNRLEDPCRGNPPGVDPEAPRTPPRAAGTGGALMSGRLWLQDSKRAWRWDSSIYGVFSIKGSLILGNVLGFTVSSIGPNRQHSSRSFGINLTDVEVEEAFFQGKFEDLKTDEQPGFTITIGDCKHSFAVSSKSEQKRWVSCLTNLSCLEDESTECRLSTPRTARSRAVSNDEDENSRLKQQLSEERERSDRLQLKIEDLLAEQKGLQEALNAALTMMSGSIATPRRSTAPRMEEESHAPTTRDDELASMGLEMALENASDSLHTTEATLSDLVYELSALVQERDAALLTIATLRGNDDADDLGSDLGSDSRSSEHRSVTPVVQKRNSSSSHTRPHVNLPSPITVPENDEMHVESEEEANTPRTTEDVRGHLPRKLRAGSVGSRGSGGKKPLGHMSFV